MNYNTIYIFQLNTGIVKYNPESDALDVHYGGEIVGSLPCYFLESNLAKLEWGGNAQSNGTIITVTKDYTAGQYYGYCLKKIRVKSTGNKISYSVIDNLTHETVSANCIIRISEDAINWENIISFSVLNTKISSNVDIPSKYNGKQVYIGLGYGVGINQEFTSQWTVSII